MKILLVIIGSSLVCGVANSATLDPRILNNIHLGPDPAILPENQRVQVEPHIARSFSDPGLMIATWQSGRYTDGGAIGNEYAVSHNGGITWTRAFVPGISSGVDGAIHERATDPVGAISYDNIIYQNSMVFSPNTDAPSGFTLSRMMPGEMVFSPPSSVMFDDYPTNAFDKNWVAVNTYPGSPTYGRIAVVGDLFGNDPNNNFESTNAITMVSVSDDLGETWSDPSPVTLDAKWAQVAQPVFLPNGNLVVGLIWFGSSENGYMSYISEDGGFTFSSRRPVHAGIRWNDIPSIRDGYWFCSLTSDRLRGILYMAWQEKGFSGESQINFSRSLDGGNLWSPPVNVRDELDGGAFNPAITATPDGQHVSILFFDNRGLLDLENNVYLAESFDGGVTWESNVRVSQEVSDFVNGASSNGDYFYGDYHAMTPALDLATPGVAIWIDGRNGNPDPYVAQIVRTRGTTYDAWKRLRFTPAQLDDPAVSGEVVDLEGDGIPNGVEYILGLEPDEVDATPFVIRGFTSPDTIELAYAALPVVTDREVVWEKSSNLTDWEAITPTSVTNERAEEAAFQNYTARFAATGDDIFFIRMGARPVSAP